MTAQESRNGEVTSETTGLSFEKLADMTVWMLWQVGETVGVFRRVEDFSGDYVVLENDCIGHYGLVGNVMMSLPDEGNGCRKDIWDIFSSIEMMNFTKKEADCSWCLNETPAHGETPILLGDIVFDGHRAWLVCENKVDESGFRQMQRMRGIEGFRIFRRAEQGTYREWTNE